MIIYKGYHHFRKHNGQITKGFFRESPGGWLAKLLNNFSIMVKEDDPLEVQVRTVIHELAHLGLEYEELTDLQKTGHPTRSDAELEPGLIEKIERATEQFYNRNPSLVQYLRDWLIDGKPPNPLLYPKVDSKKVDSNQLTNQPLLIKKSPVTHQRSIFPIN